MIAVPSYIGKSKDLQSCLREIAQVLSGLKLNSRIILKYADKDLSKTAKPIEWCPEIVDDPQSSSIDSKTVLQLLNDFKPELRNPPAQFEDPLTQNYLVLAYPFYLNSCILEIAFIKARKFNPSELAAIDSILDYIGFDTSIHIRKFQTDWGISSERSLDKTPIDELTSLKIRLEKEKQNKRLFIELNTIYSEEKNLKTLVDKSLKVICEALSFTEAICFSKSDAKLRYLSSYNISASLLEQIKTSEIPEILNHVFRNQEIVFTPNRLYKNVEKHDEFSELENRTGKTDILVPLKTSLANEGVLVFKAEGFTGFNEDQIDFLKTVVGQLTRALNQLQLIEESHMVAEKSERLARYNEALYRFTHELSTSQSLEEIFQNSFKVMQKELDIERFWLGLVNEPGTRIIGQSAFGAGWKRKLVEINIDISGKDHPLAEVIKDRKPKIFSEVDDILRGLGLKRFIEKHDIHSIGLIPLISSGQVIGILAFELSNADSFNEEDQTKKMQGFASELATAILSKRLEERLAEGETMRAAGLLAAGIAHNFNNLLQGVLGQASLLELYANNPEQIIKSSKIISDSAAKGATLVKQLLSFAYLEEAFKEDFGVNELIERNKITFQRQLKAEQFIRYNLKENLTKTRSDQKQVIRIVSALLANASEAMDDSGVVEIFTDFVEVSESNSKYEVPFGKYVIIGIRDDGKGMDLETKKRCFEPFFTTKNVDPSSGLSLSGGGMGLAASYALAKKNGGRLVVDSRLGHGSLFTLYIPVADDKIDNLEKSSEIHENRLLVDDLISEIEVISEKDRKSIEHRKDQTDEYRKLKSKLE